MEAVKEPGKEDFIKGIKIGSCANNVQVESIGINNTMTEGKHIISLVTNDGSVWIYKYETDLYHCVYKRKSYAVGKYKRMYK